MAIALMACNDAVLPLAARIETGAAESALEAIFETERHPVDVAMIGVRDRVTVPGIDPGSAFLPDLLAT